MNEVPTTNCSASEAKRRIPWIWIILLLVAAVIAGVSRYELWLSATPDDVRRADKGFRKIKETINPEQLRAWALEEIQEHSATNEANIPISEIPSYIQELFSDPVEDAGVYKYTDETNVQICWGGGFFHWMVDIGPTNYTETTGVTNNFTTVEWVPGIYYSREDTRHPFK